MQMYQSFVLQNNEVYFIIVYFENIPILIIGKETAKLGLENL